MIRSYKELYTAITGRKAVTLSVINPKQDYVLSALREAEERGWINSRIISHEDDAAAAQEAVRTIRSGEAQLLMKGDVDTAVVLKAVLHPQDGIRTHRRLSHIAVVESANYNRLMLMTDGGVNPDQTPEIFESIIKNAVELAGDLGNGHPNIAMLSLIEKINEKVPETVIARELVRRFEHRKDLTIEGPIALDVCSSEEAAAAKGIISRIAGKTDIFVGPRITTINFMVKALINLGGAQGGGIIMGAQTPVVLLSRSDTLQSKLNSIALGIIALKG